MNELSLIHLYQAKQSWCLNAWREWTAVSLLGSWQMFY